MRRLHDRSTDRRVTVVEAASILGITPDAVRSRLRRGTLRKNQAPDGTVLVVLDTAGLDDQTAGRTTDQPTVAYINALKSHIATLEREVEDWKEEARRKDHLLAVALGRNPELEVSSGPREARERTAEYTEAAAQEDTAEIRHAEQHRSWRKVFGARGEG